MAALARIGLVAALGLAGCAKDGDEHPPGTSGAEMFAKYCAGCHGPNGEGRFLDGIPSNRSTQLDASAIADRILTVSEGERHRRMPAFPKLQREEALAIAQHVLRLRETSGGARSFWENGVQVTVPPVTPGR